MISTHLICRKCYDNIDSVVAQVALGAALVSLHWFGTFDQRVEEIFVLDAEPLAQVAKDQRAVHLHLEVAGQVLLVESIVVHLHLGEGAKVIGHEHDGGVDMLQLLHGVVYAPHEHGEEGVAGPEARPLGVLHLEPFGLGLGLALHEGGCLAHGCHSQSPGNEEQKLIKMRPLSQGCGSAFI